MKKRTLRAAAMMMTAAMCAGMLALSLIHI